MTMFNSTYFWNPLKTALVLDLVVFIIAYFVFPHFEFNHLLISLIIMGLRFYFPFSLLILNYYYHDRKVRLNLKDKCLLVSDKTQKEVINFDEITQLKKYQTYSKKENRFSTLFWDRLFYYKVTLSDDTVYYISCFTCDNIEQHCSNYKWQYSQVFYPFIDTEEKR